MEIQAAITGRRISIDRTISSVLTASAGGTAIFIGTVRNKSNGMSVTQMEMEAAEDLAKADLLRIARSAASKFDVCKIAIKHRIGKMKPGDVIVVIAVSAPHRREAFAACRFVIDGLKKTAPIWKKEIGPGNARWAESER